MEPTLRSAQPSGDRLALLYRLSQAFNSSLDLDEVLNRVMDEVIAATRAERGFVMLSEDDGRLTFHVARGMDQRVIEDPAFQVSRGVVEGVARSGQAVLTSDAQSDDRFSMRESVAILGLRSILCVPLQIKEKVLGVVYVDNRLQAGIFDLDDLGLLSAIAASAAIAIENARLYKVAVEKGRLERELQVAREVQTSLLPATTPEIPGWEFAAYWRPAREVAGDYYDFIPLDRGRLGLVIADVTDKGMPAALFMTLTRSTLRASVARAASPVEGIAQTNRLICADSREGTFVSLFYASLDPATSVITYVNAGHNPPLLYRAKTGQLHRLERTGMVLGVEADLSYDQRTICLEPGDLLFLYTDGVTEAIDEQEREFGMERLQRLVLEHNRAPAAQLVAAVIEAVDEFSSTAFDDTTLVVAKCRR